MAPRSLNPQAADSAGPKLANSKNAPTASRRSLLAAFLAGVIGTFLGLFPVGAGLLTFFHPLIKKKDEGNDAEVGGLLLRVGMLENIPQDGTPVQAPVIADLTDAWNREPNQPIGAVYLRREGDKVVCFNAICPHAGCFIGYDDTRRVFQCPCHTSTFELGGDRVHPSPSPRDMDPLEVDDQKLADTGEVWVKFQNFYPGTEEREAKA